ncbi:hypothetical protein ScPMuIL_008850 [Solemya velum]
MAEKNYMTPVDKTTLDEICRAMMNLKIKVIEVTPSPYVGTKRPLIWPSRFQPKPVLSAYVVVDTAASDDSPPKQMKLKAEKVAHLSMRQRSPNQENDRTMKSPYSIEIISSIQLNPSLLNLKNFKLIL